MLALLGVLAGISWEPEIRGALIAITGSVVLMGSVWLIMATNMGSRLGTLNALAGFFAWMFIMGLVWWIYGGNVLKGDDPSWVPRETVFGDVALAGTGNAGDLGEAVLPGAAQLLNSACPGLVDGTVELQRERIVSSDDSLELGAFYTAPDDAPYCGDEETGELLAVDAETITERLTAANEALGDDDPRFREDDALADFIDDTIADQQTKVGQLTLSGLLSVASDLFDDAVSEGNVSFAGWNLVSSADAGEAQATAAAFLTSEGTFVDAGDFFVLDTFQQGGKPKRASDSVWDRVRNEVRNTVIFWHPTNTTVVQVVSTLDKVPVPGQAPPFSEIDENAQLVSVVMVRDLGSRRLPAALITIGSLLIFGALAWMLHVRDVELRRRQADWDPTADPSG